MNDLSGYGEIKVGTKVLPFKFGTNAERLFCQYHEIDLDQLDRKLAGFGFYELSYFAYVTAVRMKNELSDIGMDAFIEMAGDKEGFIEEAQKIFMASRVFGLTIEELKAMAEKKKSDTVA